MQDTGTNENRLLAALGYPIGIIALVVLLTDMKHQPYLRYHSVQALGFIATGIAVMFGWSLVLTILGTAMPFLLPLVFLTPVLVLGWIALTLLYAYRAYQGQRFQIPVVSRLTSRYTAGA
ncbi:MAG: DUF4870 domain-containing protein [Armatimonadota bacterium]|nr:DUF4870 domain-containing protein [Armatimonadota bacterium]MDR7464155.1 DUF4870 domain-containing protein [Armatimonadota bacterium]MDR7470362.1 DUF4870 domain-containing protein [Armatimonadota bacterium]MDR7474091.1 DUF4870 domain-containing protein [Armatimonadota bacterium]MDR7539134.1 DUF4870 domain-containing protein [Armatimonadota bacterium]